MRGNKFSEAETPSSGKSKTQLLRGCTNYFFKEHDLCPGNFEKKKKTKNF